MIIRYTVWRSFLKDPSEIEDIECCKDNTAKIIDYVLKNASLKREFATTPRNPDNWLFDTHCVTGRVCVFRFDGRITDFG